MAVTALISDKTFLVEQKNKLEYEEMLAVSKYEYANQEMQDIADQDDGTDSGYTDTDAYKELSREQEYWDSKKSTIESQLEEIKTEIESYDKAVSTNVKTECSFSISV